MVPLCGLGSHLWGRAVSEGHDDWTIDERYCRCSHRFEYLAEDLVFRCCVCNKAIQSRHESRELALAKGACESCADLKARAVEFATLVSCPGMDDGDFHAKDRFELAEAMIKISNLARSFRASLKDESAT